MDLYNFFILNERIRVLIISVATQKSGSRRRNELYILLGVLRAPQAPQVRINSSGLGWNHQRVVNFTRECRIPLVNDETHRKIAKLTGKLWIWPENGRFVTVRSALVSSASDETWESLTIPDQVSPAPDRSYQPRRNFCDAWCGIGWFAPIYYVSHGAKPTQNCDERSDMR